VGLLNPTFAVGREQEGAWRAAAAVVRAFRTSYGSALGRWCAGIRDAVFPAGTWWMRVFHSAGVPDAALAT
jgi:putative transposase